MMPPLRRWWFFGSALCLGIAFQGAMFTAALVAAAAELRIRGAPVASRRRWTRLGICATAIWALFPLSSLLRSALGPSTAAVAVLGPDHPLLTHGPSLAALLSSPVPSAVLAAGLFLLGAGRWSPNPTVHDPAPEQCSFSSFSSGVLAGTVALALYGVTQHVTGWDLYQPDGFIGWDKSLGEGRFRVRGFFSHPLTLAGVSMALACGYGVIWAGSPSGALLRRQAAAITVLHTGLVFISGGRSALVFTLAVLAVIASGLGWTRRTRVRLSLALIALVAGGAATGLAGRFAEMVTGPFNRWIFWQLHGMIIRDQPWLGASTAWIRSGLRLAYYDAKGLETFSEKFNAHNIYLELLTHLGVLGCSLLLVLLTMAWRLLVAPWPTLQRQAFTMAVVANLLHGVTQNTFFDSSVMYVYLYWTVAASALQRRSAPQTATNSADPPNKNSE